MSNSVKIQNDICEAISNIVSTVANDYDRTVQATVLKCEDEALGKYKVKYQDAIFYAYATNLKESYIENSNVYINIPNNDMNQEKTIIGSVKKVGNLSIVEESDSYITVGQDFYCGDKYNIALDGKNHSFLICSAYESAYFSLLEDLLTTLTQTDLVKISSLFQTVNFSDINRNGNGRYGIKIYISDGKKSIFSDTTYEQIEEYVNNKNLIEILDFNLDSFIGNPYKLDSQTEQSAVFSLEAETKAVLLTKLNNLKGITDEDLGEKDFKGIEILGYVENFDIDSSYKIPGIICQDIRLTSVNAIPKEDTSNIKLYLQTPKGNAFPKGASDSFQLTLEAIVKDYGITKNTDNLQCYWFEQDSSITEKSNEYYDKGGSGWRCLNKKEQGEFIPLPATYSLTKADVPSAQKEYKCVAIYNNLVLTSTIIIKNFGVVDTIQIVENDNKYRANLVKENNEIENLSTKIEDGYFVKWYFINSAKVIKYCNPDQKNELYSFLEDNKVIKINTDEIIGTGELKAELHYKRNGSITYIASSTIKIESTSSSGQGNLIINNREQVFLYDQNGNSPLKEGSLYPSVIYPLTFDFYGEEEEVETIKWKVPKEKTLLRIEGKEDGDFYTYSGANLAFSIADDYDLHSYDNIYLEVQTNKGNIYFANTNFSFVKEGENGTVGNGTFCRIVLNSLEGQQEPEFALLKKENGTFNINYKLSKEQFDQIIIGSSYNLFRAQLWKQNSKLYDNYEFDPSIGSIKWEILQNNNNLFTIDENNGAIRLVTNDCEQSPCCKVQISKDSVVYSAITPLLIQIVNLNKEEKSFAILNPYQKLKLVFNYDSNGEIDKRMETGELIFHKPTSNLSLILNKPYSLNSNADINNNIATITPYTYFSNSNSISELRFQYIIEASSGIGAPLYDSQILIPTISHINKVSENIAAGWQGGAVSIEEEEGTILAETIAAGVKENDYSFTGSIIGKKDNDEIGFVGYNEGVRTIFLDSQEGSAIFGTERDRQVIIEEDGNQGRIIKTGSYDSKDKTGLEINFTTPSIIFGDKDFCSIDKTKEETILSQWHINNPHIYADNKSVGISYNDNTELEIKESNQIELYLPYESEPKPEDKNKNLKNRTKAFWTKKNTAESYITHDGVINATAALFSNKKIYIGKDKENDEDIIAFGEKTSLKESYEGLYLSKENIALGNKKVSKRGRNAHNFYVNKDGHLQCTKTEIKDYDDNQGWEIIPKSLSYYVKSHSDEDTMEDYYKLISFSSSSSYAPNFYFRSRPNNISMIPRIGLSIQTEKNSQTEFNCYGYGIFGKYDNTSEETRSNALFINANGISNDGSQYGGITAPQPYWFDFYKGININNFIIDKNGNITSYGGEIKGDTKITGEFKIFPNKDNTDYNWHFGQGSCWYQSTTDYEFRLNMDNGETAILGFHNGSNSNILFHKDDQKIGIVGDLEISKDLYLIGQTIAVDGDTQYQGLNQTVTLTKEDGDNVSLQFMNGLLISVN